MLGLEVVSEFLAIPFTRDYLFERFVHFHWMADPFNLAILADDEGCWDSALACGFHVIGVAGLIGIGRQAVGAGQFAVRLLLVIFLLSAHFAVQKLFNSFQLFVADADNLHTLVAYLP